MNTRSKPHLPHNATLLAGLLERLEAGRDGRAQAGPAPDPAQYREVAQRLSRELADLPRDAALDALLISSPAAATVYENLRYEQAGLCRTPLEAATAAELQAQEMIARARRRAEPAT